MRLLPTILLIACLTGLVLPGPALGGPADGERTVLPELGISVQVPPEWSTKRVNSAAVLLIPADAHIWPMEIVTWTTPAPVRTLEQAVAGHEKLLAQRWHYERRTLEPLTTTAGWPAFAVTGAVTTDEGARYTALFAVYVLSGGYLVVGTFCSPQHEQSVMADIFGPLAASIGPAAHSPRVPLAPPITDRAAPTATPRPPEQSVAPPPPQVLRPPDQPSAPPQFPPPVAAPQTDRAPSAAGPSQPPEPPRAPARPGPRPPVPPGDEWTERAFPEGLVIKLPPGWATALQSGLLHAYDPRCSRGVFVCPLYAVPGDGSNQVAQAVDVQTALAHCQGLLGTTVAVDGVQRLEPGQVPCDVITGHMAVAGEQVRTIVAVSRCERAVLLTAAYAAQPEFDQALPLLRLVLATVAVARLTPIVPELLTGETLPWTSPDGRLTIQLPVGWRARGGVTEYNGHTAISLDGQFAGSPRLRFAWRQPRTPFFRELTPLLRGLNQLPGQLYHERPDESPLVIMSKLAPGQLVTRHLVEDIAPHLQDIRIEREEACDPAAALVQGTDRSGTLLQIEGRSLAGPLVGTYLLGIADLPITEGSFRWQTGYLAWLGASGLEWAARLALHTVLATARPARGDTAEAKELASLIEAARGVLPAAGVEARPRLVPLLSPAFRPQAAGEIRLPASLLSYWQPISTAPPGVE